MQLNYKYNSIKGFRKPSQAEILQISEMYIYGGKRARAERLRKFINFLMTITSGFFILAAAGYIFYVRNVPAIPKDVITNIDRSFMPFLLCWGIIHCLVAYENRIDKAFKKGKFLVLEGKALKYKPPIFTKGEFVQMADGLEYNPGGICMGRITFQSPDGHIITNVKMDIGGSFIPKDKEQYQNFDVYLVTCKGRVRAFTNWYNATEDMKSCHRPSKM